MDLNLNVKIQKWQKTQEKIFVTFDPKKDFLGMTPKALSTKEQT